MPNEGNAPTIAGIAARRRQQALRAVVLLAFLALSALLVEELVRAHGEVAQHARLERDTLVHLDQIESLYAALKDAESAFRGVLLTGEPVFSEQFRLAFPRAQLLLEQLRADARAHTAEGGDLRDYLTRVEARLAAIGNLERVMLADGAGAAADLLRSQIRSEAFGAILAAKDRLERGTRETMQERGSGDAPALSVLRLSILGIGVNALLVLLLAALAVRQNRQRSEVQKALSHANRRMEGQLDTLRRLGNGMERLGRLGQLLQASLTLDEAVQAIQRSLPRMLDGIDGVLFLYNPSRSHLAARTRWGTLDPEGAEVFAADDCWSLRQGRPHFSGAGGEAPACAHLRSDGDTRRDCLCIPLVAHGRTLGVLHLQGEPGILAAHESLLEPITEQAAMSLSNLELRENLRNESIRDPLTGLFNRRYLESSFEREIARAGRRGAGLSLILFDIDHFKRFNDTFGHAAGDAVLEAFGDLLLTRARKEDLPCRLGGEEFALVLADSDAVLARERAEGIRSALTELRLEHVGRALGTVTLSAGIASFPRDGERLDALLRAADKALYRAKDAGRNRVEMAVQEA